MELKSTLVVSFIVGVLALSGGWYAGYQQAIGSTKATLERLGFVTPTDVRSIDGTVKSVSGSSFVLEFASFDPLRAGEKEVKTVHVNGATTLEKFVPKDAAELDAEMAQYNALLADFTSPPSSPPPVPPESFARERISLSDIEIGSRVVVTSEENIVDASSFTAASVLVRNLGAVVSPAPAPAAAGGTEGSASAVPPPPAAGGTSAAPSSVPPPPPAGGTNDSLVPPPAPAGE